MADHSRTAKVTADPKGIVPVLLVARVPDKELGKYTLTEGSITVGSGSANHLVVDHPTVSRSHLRVELRAGGVWIEDLGSTNGTRFQGAQVQQLMVPIGATLVIGNAELSVEPADQAELTVLGGLSSRSPAMQRAIKALAKAAPGDVTILLEGETGVGKEIAARAVHGASRRAAGPFQVVDCGALSRELAASELFGHAKGSFTGADRERRGALETASGGTLLLDEVGELPLDLQPLLLRALESREIRRVGETEVRKIDVRVIAATHRDLLEESENGRFRRDLLHRLSVLQLRLPPLRERKEDIPILARAILQDLPSAQGFTLGPETLRAFAGYRWPGNIRELRNLIERAIALQADPQVALAGTGAEAPKEAALEYHEARKSALDAFEKDFVLQVLRKFDGNVSRAAKESGIDRVYLHKLIKKHGIE
jgi:DNA-binding NtrC family response regulator